MVFVLWYNESMKAYKTELRPNNKQKTLFRQCIGASRYVYNWGLAEWQAQYKAGEKPSVYALRKYFNSIKDDLCPWIRSLPYCVVESALDDLGSAYKHFFRRVKNGENPGYPKFKAKGKKSSFGMRGYKTRSNSIYFGRKIGWVKLKERAYIPNPVTYRLNGGTTYCTISEHAGRWYVSIQIKDEDDTTIANRSGTIGLDLGIKSLAVCSDGTVYHNVKAYDNVKTKRKRIQKELSRRTRGGQNWKKTKRKLQRLEAKVANTRKHILHNLTYDMVVNKTPKVIVIENLNVKGMMSNRRLSRAIADIGFYELRRQLEYKCEWYGCELVIASRWYPSSKRCSGCGHVKDKLSLSERVYICDKCGLELDRDLNAAKNLEQYYTMELHKDYK